MLMISVICLLVATLIFGITSCFTQRNTPLFFLTKTASLICLACLAVVCANYKNAFDGYSILIIFSVLPAFLMIFDLKAYLDAKKNVKTNEEIFADENQLPKKEKKQSKIFQSNGQILFALSCLLISVCIGIASLYKGIETIYSFGLGISLGFAGTFLTIIIKKNISAYDLLSAFLVYVSVGILFSQIVMVILYSTAIANLLYCVGAFLLGIFGLLKLNLKSKFLDLIYYLGMIAVIASIII